MDDNSTVIDSTKERSPDKDPLGECYIAQALSMLEDFDASWDADGSKCKDQILALLRDHEAPLDRSSFEPGHVTASAILFSPDEKSVALVYHKKLDRWLQPGGHVETQDESVLVTAAREAREECGVELDEEFTPRLLSLDVHEIPAHGQESDTQRYEPLHWHHDFMFLFRAKDAGLSCSAESAEVRWVVLEDLPAYELDACTTRGLAQAIGD